MTLHLVRMSITSVPLTSHEHRFLALLEHLNQLAVENLIESL
jgi:hypothetical protein